MTYFAAFLYVGAMLLANLLVSKFGPAISPVLAFFLIGFDLSMRDWLHVRLRVWQMICLICVAWYPTWILVYGFVLCFGLMQGARGPVIAVMVSILFRGGSVGTIFGALALGLGLGPTHLTQH